MKLHEIIKNFYIKRLVPIFSIEVLGQNGNWNKIKSLNITEKQFLYKIKTEHTELLCTENHILIDENEEEILAVKSQNQKIKTANGVEKVISVQKTEIFDQAYDLSLAENTDHLYYTNGFLSHNCVIMDEAAFVPNNIASRVFESIYPVISSSKTSQFIIVSTPNGADPNNLYYSIWQKANRKESDKNAEGWKAFRIDWFDVPGRDEQWKNNTIASIGARRFAQEFGNEFLSNASTKKLIDEDIIEKFRMKLSEYKIKNVKPKTQRIISEKQDRLYEFQMWHEFDKDRTYVASGDIAEGVGGDASVLQVWDVTDTKNITLVAKFSSNRVSLVEFAYICSKILPLYGNPYLFAERNGLSAGMIDALRITYQYPNIACESKNGEAGIYSHVSVKIKACLWARDMLTTDGFGFRIYDKELIDEMSTFVKKDGKSDKTMYVAISPAHDDNIMSFVWMCYSLQNDVVDKYYVLVDTFKSVFDQFHPARLAPLTAYTSDTLKRISNDPIYRDFMDFKEQNMSEYMKLMQAEERENRNDVFKYSPDDMYFGGAWEGGGWNTGSGQTYVNPNNHMPAYFI